MHDQQGLFYVLLVGVVALVAVGSLFYSNYNQKAMSVSPVDVSPGVSEQVSRDSNVGGMATFANGKKCNRHWECASGYCYGSAGHQCSCKRDYCYESWRKGRDWRPVCGNTCETCEVEEKYRKCQTVDLKVPGTLVFDFDDGSPSWSWDEVPIRSGVTATLHPASNGPMGSESSQPPYHNFGYDYLFSLADYVGPAFYLDGQFIGRTDLHISEWGGGYMFYFKYKFDIPAGIHKLKVVLDPDNNIKEPNENNNVIERTLIVSGGCSPSCTGKACGADDGCGGKCQGSCPKGQSCQAGVCVSSNPINPIVSGGSCASKGGTCQWKSSCPQGGSNVGHEDCGSKWCCASGGKVGGSGGGEQKPDSPCNNGVKDIGESDVDCGGSCKKCALKQACGVNADCVSGQCKSGKCTDNCGTLWAANGAVGTAYCSQTATCPPGYPSSLGESTDCVMCCLKNA